MKVLVIHNILWAHYKSVLFQEIFENSKGKFDFHVIQIAKSEISRKNMNYNENHFNYPYSLLFDDFIDNLNFGKKTFKLFKAIYEYKPDIINITGYASDASITAAIFFSKMLRCKIIISNESSINDNVPNKFKENIKRMIISFADYFICFGKRSTDFIVYLGAKRSQIIENKAAVVDDKVVRNIDKSATKICYKHKYNFVFVGRLIEVKNLEVLFLAFDRFKNNFQFEFSDWGLVCVGDGEKLEVLNKMANDSVHFFPAVDWQEVPRYLSKQNVFVLPSKSEAWGLVVNEAMLCGMPIIVSNKCGCVDDLLDQNGFSFDWQNENELYESMVKMASNKEMREQMSEKSLEIIKTFDAAKVGQRLANQFQKIA